MFFKSKASKGEPNGGASDQAHASASAIGAGPSGSGQAGKSGGELSAEEAQRRRMKSKELQAAFGGIVSLMMRSAQLRNITLAEVEGLVVPAVATGQFMIAEAQSKENGSTAPVAAVLWASVSEEVDRRLSEKTDQPAKLEPKEWKSGDIPWLIMAAGDKRFIKTMLEQLQSKTLKGRTLKTRAKGANGKAHEAAVATS